MTKLLTALAIGLLLGALMASPATAEPNWPIRWQTARFRSLEGSDDAYSRREVALTIRAAFRLIVPSQTSTAVRVASCESGLNEDAYNPGGPYVGVFQQHLASWPSRVAAFSGPHGPLAVRSGASWHSARAQAIVSARMVRSDGGWGQWSCY